MVRAKGGWRIELGTERGGYEIDDDLDGGGHSGHYVRRGIWTIHSHDVAM